MSSTTGRIPEHRLTAPVQTAPGRAAYADAGLHLGSARVSRTGRYAMPTEGKPYIWRDPDRLAPIRRIGPVSRNA